MPKPPDESNPSSDNLNVNERLDRIEMALEVLADWVVNAQKHGITTHDTTELEKIQRGESAKSKGV